MIAWLRRITSGEAIFPLVILFLLYFFDEFDTSAFAVLVPNIQETFGLSDNAIATIIILNLSVVLLLAIPLGYYGDRLPRRTFVVAGGIVAGVFSFLTGTAAAVWVLIAYRFGNGMGRLVNGPIHNSLLTDYYRPEDRVGVFTVHRNAVNLGHIVGPAVAGTIAWALGWRWAFMVLILPIVTCAIVALRLPEPLRGGTEDRHAAEEVDKEAPPPFERAVRTILSIRTLRRQYMAWVFIGAGLIPLAFYVPLFLEREFGVGEFGRGLAGSANAAATFAGILYSRRLTNRWMGKGIGHPLKAAGWALAGVGPGLFLVGISPWLWLALAAGFATSFVGGLFWVPFLTIQAFVSPARVRSLAFSYADLFLVGGVWFLFILTGVSQISDTHGIRWGLVATTPYWIVGGLVLRSAHRFVSGDAERSLATLRTAAAIRAERLSATSDTMLVIRDLDVSYGQTQVLFGVDLDVREGELVALLGTNGAGKSTLLKAISGLIQPQAGSIFFDGEDITHHAAEETAAMGIIQMPGGKAIFPALSVRENLDMAAWLYAKDRPYARSAIDRGLGTFPILRERLDQRAGSLSGGEQQMLSLAQAFIARPRLLMIDELSLGLAPIVVQQLMGIVADIHAQGTTIVLVEQSVNIALTVARHAYFMEKGEIRFDGPTAELLERGDILRSVFLEGVGSVRR